MARIVLVNPQLACSSWAVSVMRSMSDAAIKHGIASLSACLKAAGHEVNLIDLRLLRGWREYEACLKQGVWDCLGVTANTSEHDAAIECCRRAKKIHPSLLTIAGGIQPTMFPNEFLKSEVVDFVLKGEGEVSILKWIENPSGFPPVLTGETPALDKLPFVDRELWPDYKKRTAFPWLGRHLATPIVGMLAHRGCPWHCKFCCGPGERNVFAKVRARSVEHLMQELAELHERYSFRGIFFHDDQFLINPAWVEEFCSAMHAWDFVKKGIGFMVSLRSDTIVKHKSHVQQLKEAGLRIVTIGFESFSDRLLRWMNKGVTLAQHMEAVNILRGLKVEIRAGIMLGLPGADGKWYPEDDLKTMKTLRQIRPEMVHLAIFSPVPGSVFYDWYNDRGLILSNEFSHLAKRGVPQLKNVDYDFLSILIGKKIEKDGKLKSVLRQVRLLEPLRRIRAGMTRAFEP